MCGETHLKRDRNSVVPLRLCLYHLQSLAARWSTYPRADWGDQDVEKAKNQALAVSAVGRPRTQDLNIIVRSSVSSFLRDITTSSRFFTAIDHHKNNYQIKYHNSGCFGRNLKPILAHNSRSYAHFRRHSQRDRLASVYRHIVYLSPLRRQWN